jgi:uncharacterized membrane protein
LVNSIALIQEGASSIVFNVIGAQHITNYTWDFGDLTDTSGTGLPGEMTHIYAGPGTYTVTLTLSNDCGEITVTKLVLIENPTDIGDISALQKEFNLFPNPSKTVVTIANKAGIKVKQIVLSNLVGQNVYMDNEVNADKVTIDISGLAPGIYNASIITEKGIVNKKLEVIK